MSIYLPPSRHSRAPCPCTAAMLVYRHTRIGCLASARAGRVAAQEAAQTHAASRIRAARSHQAPTHVTRAFPKAGGGAVSLADVRRRALVRKGVTARRAWLTDPHKATWHQPAPALLRRRQTTPPRCPTRAASSRRSRRPASRRCLLPTTSPASSRCRRRPLLLRSGRLPGPRRRSCPCCSVAVLKTYICFVVAPRPSAPRRVVFCGAVSNTHCILTKATSPSARRRAGEPTSRGDSPLFHHPKPSPPSA